MAIDELRGGATIKVVIKLCGTRDCLKIEMYMDLATTLMCREHNIIHVV